jgi:hypothetical protein
VPASIGGGQPTDLVIPHPLLDAICTRLTHASGRHSQPANLRIKDVEIAVHQKTTFRLQQIGEQFSNPLSAHRILESPTLQPG